MNKNLILIDTSYTLFHRYFATLRWLSLAHPELYKEKHNKEFNWIENSIFLEKYEKLYYENILKLIGKKILKDDYTIIFCMDTPRSQVWRTELNCNYKGDRFDLTTKFNFIPLFKYTYDVIIPKLIKENEHIFKIKIPKLEADDVIAIICKYMEQKPDNKIYLISGDKDFLQLGRSNLYFINFTTKKLMELNQEEAKLLLHKKLLLGDKSDCIKSIFPPRFPSKIKKSLVESIDNFNDFIKNNDDIKKNYIHNSELINFDLIPNKYRELVINKIHKINL